jgi:hypothetical protein
MIQDLIEEKSPVWEKGSDTDLPDLKGCSGKFLPARD